MHEIIDRGNSFNREVWDFNLGLDKVLVRTVTRGYVNVVPDPFRRGLGNAIENFFSTPQYAINNLLQGKIGGFFTTVSRLVINSTIGLGGFIDVASNMGIQKRPETFGDTLGVWGWKKSSYVQIPFKGPQTSRDVVGFIGDIFTDPLIFIGVPLWGNLVKTAGTAVDERQDSLGVLEEIESTSNEEIHSDNVSDSVHSIADEISKISKLKSEGSISEEEFQKMKNELIDKM